jgi:intracellular septation protein
VVFGGATLILHDETFIKWKPTILYWLFAVTLFASAQFFGKNLIRAMLDQQVELPDALWPRLNYAWIGFFAVMGVLNLWVAFNFSTDTWVSFKLFGGMGLMLVFIVLQGLVLAKYIPEDKEAAAPPAGDKG